jgi:hypothetical protein
MNKYGRIRSSKGDLVNWWRISNLYPMNCIQGMYIGFLLNIKKGFHSIRIFWKSLDWKNIKDNFNRTKNQTNPCMFLRLSNLMDTMPQSLIYKKYKLLWNPWKNFQMVSTIFLKNKDSSLSMRIWERRSPYRKISLYSNWLGFIITLQITGNFFFKNYF